MDSTAQQSTRWIIFILQQSVGIRPGNLHEPLPNNINAVPFFPVVVLAPAMNMERRTKTFEENMAPAALAVQVNCRILLY
jgi:hypothetical protein